MPGQFKISNQLWLRTFGRPWIYGGPFELWLSNREVLVSLREKLRLEPTPREQLWDIGAPMHMAMGETEGPEGARTAIRWPPFPGGIRAPHIHLDGELYQLTPDQWAVISREIVGGLREKLDHAGTVGFEKIMELSHVMADMDVAAPGRGEG